jgi:hypothetical protein
MIAADDEADMIRAVVSRLAVVCLAILIGIAPGTYAGHAFRHAGHGGHHTAADVAEDGSGRVDADAVPVVCCPICTLWFAAASAAPPSVSHGGERLAVDPFPVMLGRTPPAPDEPPRR